MENVFEISMLLDFYGQLLTERQYEILDLHYNNDYSLAEIAEQLNISRQGVHDNIKRGCATLSRMEEKLGLMEKFNQQKSKAKEVLMDLDSLDRSSMTEQNSDIVNRIGKSLRDMISSI